MAESIILKASYLWSGDKLISNGALLIESGIIKAVGTFDEISKHTHKKIVEWKKSTILPGLIDSHTHLAMNSELPNYLDQMADDVETQTKRALELIKKDLKAGITTLRGCGDKEFLDVKLKSDSETGKIESPRLVVASRSVRAPKGHGFVGYPIGEDDKIVAFIHENIEKGANFIKFYVTGTLKGTGDIPSFLSSKTIKLIIDEAHKAGMKTAAHCVGGVGLDWCVEYGLDTLEHAYHITDEQISRLAKSSTTLVLTPSPLFSKSRILNLPEHLIPGHFNEQNKIKERMSAAIKAGVQYAVGTDAMHGNLAQELVYLVEMGETPENALKAATIRGAEICGIEKEIGTIQKGKIADIVVVEGNPLKNIETLQKVKAVIKHGEIIKL